MILQRLLGAFLLATSLGISPSAVVAQEAPPLVLPRDQQEPDSLLFNVRDAIVRALTYFSAPDRTLDPDATLIHAYLKDRYGLPELCSAESVIAGIRENPKDEMYKFLCLAEPVPFRDDFLELRRQGFNDITLSGMYYDHLPDRSMLMERIKAAPIDQDYMATHALWAMAMAQHYFKAQEDTLLEQRLVEQVTWMMEQGRPQWDDQAIEGLAMLQYHDPNYVPPWEYVKEVLDMQNPDGSWTWNPGQDKGGSQHSTVLALWALLQYKPLAWPTRPRNMVLR